MMSQSEEAINWKRKKVASVLLWRNADDVYSFCKNLFWRSIHLFFVRLFFNFFPSTILITADSEIKFIYSEKATRFCEISTLLLSYVVPVKSKVEISQNFVAFLECMNFTKDLKNVRNHYYPQLFNICK